ncbi:hypothetical protein V6N11_046102 [Hibiscus sabdariffa]|uniref:Uncharacterized protein n=1 Tax=Hibiscus sabdariffa TaxID=183260 RepID=A0ABR2N824_9ROSI
MGVVHAEPLDEVVMEIGDDDILEASSAPKLVGVTSVMPIRGDLAQCTFTSCRGVKASTITALIALILADSPKESFDLVVRSTGGGKALSHSSPISARKELKLAAHGKYVVDHMKAHRQKDVAMRAVADVEEMNREISSIQ